MTTTNQTPTPKCDPVCLIHGRKMSEHVCLYCCLCFRPLTPDQCHVQANGRKEDVCEACSVNEHLSIQEHFKELRANLATADALLVRSMNCLWAGQHTKELAEEISTFLNR